MADFNPINYVGFQDPAAAIKLQQQQALAAQLMAESEPRKNINDVIGSGPYAQVAPYSPLEGLSKALEKGVGAYAQVDANDKLAKALQGPSQADMMGNATNAAIQGEGGMGPATAKDVASKYSSQLGAALSGDKPANMMKYAQMNAMSPGLGTEMFKRDSAGAVKAAEVAQTPQDFNGHKGFMTPPALSGNQPSSGLPIPPSLQQGMINQDVAPTAAVMPTALSPEKAAQVDSLYGAGAENTAAPVNIQRSPNVDFNNPVEVKGAESEATKTGENAADVGKTMTVMQSNLPMVLDRFEKMRGAAKDASYGAGTTVGEDGSPPVMVTAHDMINDKTAKANGIIQQTSAQGVLPELGPTLAQAGIKGNKFLETLSSNASAIPLHQAPDVKLNTIDGLESQYINNLKSTAAQARAHGMKAPSDPEIDAQISQLKQRSSALAHAREAIANGAPKDAVMKRLQDMQIDASGL